MNVCNRFSYSIIMMFSFICFDGRYLMAADRKSSIEKAAKKIERCWCQKCQSSWFARKKHPYTLQDQILAYLMRVLPHANGKGQLPLAQLVVEYATEHDLPRETWLPMKSWSGWVDSLQGVTITTSHFAGGELIYSKIPLINDPTVSFSSAAIDDLKRVISDPDHRMEDYKLSDCKNFRIKGTRAWAQTTIERQVRIDHIQRAYELAYKQKNKCVIS